MTQPDVNKLAMIYKLIESHPGECAAQIQRLAQTSKTYLYNHGLHIMEDFGFLLYEDDKGGLYPFRAIDIAQDILFAREKGLIAEKETLRMPTARVLMR